MIAEALASLIPKAPRRMTNASLENPTYSLNDPALYDVLAGGQKSASGIAVTHERALCLPAVWQAVSLISGDAAKLPLYPYKRMKDDDREIADKHPAYFAVAVRANPVKSAFQFWRTMYVHATLWNNGYAYIRPTLAGVELYNLLPDRTAPEWVKYDSGGVARSELVYVTEVDGKLVTLMPKQVLHIPGLSADGMAGYDLLKAAKESWGLALAAQNFESKFFKNGARMGGTLELPAAMSKPAKDNVEEGFRKTYEEGDNPFKVVILREGAKFHAGQVTPQQGQVVELDEKGKRDVASYFNIPPSKLGIIDSVSYNSFEQDNLSYLHGCLHHWTCAGSDECDMKLLSEDELRKDTHYFEHNYSQFIQADWKTMNDGLEIMRRNEVINADEWRRKMNMNKRPDGGGGEYINPNTRSPEDSKTDDKPPAKKNDKKAVANAIASLGNAQGEALKALNELGSIVATKDDAAALARLSGQAAESLANIAEKQGKAASDAQERLDGIGEHMAAQVAGQVAMSNGMASGFSDSAKRDHELSGAIEGRTTVQQLSLYRECKRDVATRVAKRVSSEASRAFKSVPAASKWLNDLPANLAEYDSFAASMIRRFANALSLPAEAEVASVSRGLLCSLKSELEPLLKPPFKPADLSVNAAAIIQTFERTAPERVAATIMELKNE